MYSHDNNSKGRNRKLNIVSNNVSIKRRRFVHEPISISLELNTKYIMNHDEFNCDIH